MCAHITYNRFQVQPIDMNFERISIKFHSLGYLLMAN